MPFECDKLLHPFQNDPGTSQSGRVMAALLGGPAEIDGRSMADLLQFFVSLAPNIVYYDQNLNPGVWTPFFQKSLPFLLAGMTNFTTDSIDSKLALYAYLFKKKPSGSGLQLNLFYIYYNLVRQINTWSCQLAGSQLPIETTINKLIVNNLKQPLLQYIGIVNAAVKWYGVRKVDFSPLVNNPAWGLDVTDLYALDTAFKKAGPSQRKRLLALEREAAALVPAFAAALGVLAGEAPGNIQQSFTPVAAELQQNHQPHLALIFVFLQLFLKLQCDINGFKKEHLDFFYTNVLQLKPQPAVPDHANLIVYLQNQVQSFTLQKGWLVKDGKDDNKADILFGLDDTIAANVTQATDIRTLFFNNQTAYDQTWTEGAYMAPNARMADGVNIAFSASSPNNYPTLGAKYSKYTPPLSGSPQEYPGARIGFLLASNVLFLNEGTRHVHIRLNCKVESEADACGTDEDYPAFVDPTKLYPFVEEVLQHVYVEITEDLIQQAQQQGVSQNTGSAIQSKWLVDHCHKSLCVGAVAVTYYKDNAVIRWHEWQHWLNGQGFSAGEFTIINLLFLKIYPFNVNFSGAKQWIAPEELRIVVDPPLGLGGGNAFDIHIHARLGADQPAVTFYSAKALGEDFNTTQPVVKIELNDVIKVQLVGKVQNALGLTPSGTCCLDVPFDFCGATISLYQLFRFVKLTRTHIHVKVLGVKNFIVQNDDSLQNVNSPILPWGSRPKVSSNFYIGCEEIFLKYWENINVNLNWKDFPTSTVPVGFTGPFNYYYNGYQDSFANGATDGVVYDNLFQIQLYVLQDGEWVVWSRPLTCTNVINTPINMFQPAGGAPPWQYQITRAADFAALGAPKEAVTYLGLKQLDVSTRQSFIKITMQCQDFGHDRYAYALARQMSAFGKLPTVVDGAVYFGVTPPPGSQFVTLDIDQLLKDVLYMSQLANDATLNPPNSLAGGPGLVDQIGTALTFWAGHPHNLVNAVNTINDIIAAYAPAPPVHKPPPPAPGSGNYADLGAALNDIFTILASYEAGIAATDISSGVVIPNLPWTPTITNMSLDYEAVADERSISLIHLYPFTGTYEAMQIRLLPPLFPRYCDEGTLFVGLSGLVPGNPVNFLFQLAEATANSESNAATLYYSYLAGNQWLPLRPGYEVLHDYTEGLTRTGILELALPANMTNTNTVMPGGLWWIKAAVAQNVEAVSDTFIIQTQAMSATFLNVPLVNDQTRMGTPLLAGSLSRLATAYTQVKSIGQPYPSFGGAPPEAQGAFYVRVSELLHHKGRAIQKFDYERLVLQQFPVIFKAKCINHSFALDGELYKNDFPIAPGYVLLAVIPDLNQLAAGNSLQPKVPVSILEDIYTYISGLTSPFVRFRAMNPRYETINFCIEVRLLQGYDQVFYQQQLATDLSQFLAPWAVGQYSKLTFGQPVYRSDVVGFIESLYYIDYIIKLQMLYEDETTLPLHPHLVIYGKTPRSILIGGDIEVIADMPGCPEWGEKNPCKMEQFKVRDCDSIIKKEEAV